MEARVANDGHAVVIVDTGYFFPVDKNRTTETKQPYVITSFEVTMSTYQKVLLARVV